MTRCQTSVYGRQGDQPGDHDDDPGGDHGTRAVTPRPEPGDRPGQRRGHGAGQQEEADLGGTGPEAVLVGGDREELVDEIDRHRGTDADHERQHARLPHGGPGQHPQIDHRRDRTALDGDPAGHEGGQDQDEGGEYEGLREEVGRHREYEHERDQRPAQQGQSGPVDA